MLQNQTARTVRVEKSFDVPNNLGATMAYLNGHGMTIGGDKDKANRVLERFSTLAKEGYNLGIAPHTAHMEAMKILGSMPQYFGTLSIRSEMDLTLDLASDVRREMYTGFVKTNVGTRVFNEVDTSEQGPIHAIHNAFRKVMRQNYIAAPVRYVMSYPEILSEQGWVKLGQVSANDDPTDTANIAMSNTASPARVTVLFATEAHGVRTRFAVQDVGAGLPATYAAALVKGISYGYHLQGVKSRLS